MNSTLSLLLAAQMLTLDATSPSTAAPAYRAIHSLLAERQLDPLERDAALGLREQLLNSFSVSNLVQEPSPVRLALYDMIDQSEIGTLNRWMQIIVEELPRGAPTGLTAVHLDQGRRQTLKVKSASPRTWLIENVPLHGAALEVSLAYEEGSFTQPFILNEVREFPPSPHIRWVTGEKIRLDFVKAEKSSRWMNTEVTMVNESNQEPVWFKVASQLRSQEVDLSQIAKDTRRQLSVYVSYHRRETVGMIDARQSSRRKLPIPALGLKSSKLKSRGF